MFSRFFIEHPIFATVVSLVIVIAGSVSMFLLPVEQYPTITPVQVTVSATYPGADSQTVAESVAAPIEAQINGVDNMLYMTSTSSSNGQLQLTVYFSLDTDPDIAQVQVQNRVNLAAAATARGRDPAGRLGAEEVLLHHDVHRRLREGRALRSQLYRQLCQRLRPGPDQAGPRRRAGADHGRARPGDEDLDEPGPDGLARDHDERHPAGGGQPEPALRRGPDRTGADGGTGAADVSRRHPAPVQGPGSVRQHHPPGQPGRQRHRPPEGRGTVGDRASAVHRRQQAQRRSRDVHRRLPAAGRQRPAGVGGGPQGHGGDEIPLSRRDRLRHLARHDRFRAHLDRRGEKDAVRGGAAGRARGLSLSAEFPRHRHLHRGHLRRPGRDLRRHDRPRVLHQPPDPLRPDIGHRHRRGRCHRGRGKRGDGTCPSFTCRPGRPPSGRWGR